ncbi:hypothetical protein ACHAXT_001309 [Thalassiosira profunda]
MHSDHGQFCLSLLEDQFHGNAHLTFVDEASASALFQQLDAFCEANINGGHGSAKPLVVSSDAGVGKSSALATWAAQRQAAASPARRLDFPEFVFFHTVGCSRLSTQVTNLLRRLVNGLIEHFQLKEAYDLADAKLPWVLPRLLERASKKGSVVIVLDGGLQLICSKDKEYGLKWLPLTVPPNVRLIVSATQPPAEVSPKLSIHAQRIQAKISATWDEIQRRKWPTQCLEPLQQSGVADFVEKYLSLSCLQNDVPLAERRQIVDIIIGHEQATNLLFLTSLLRGLCHAIASGYNVNHCLVAWMPCRTPTELVEHQLSLFESGVPRKGSLGTNAHRLGSLLGDSLSLLFVARHGLHEDELMELLDRVKQQSRWTEQIKDTPVETKLKILQLLLSKKKRLIDVFRAFDADANGTLSYEEFHRGMQKLDIDVSVAEVAALIAEVDSDGDGEIDYQEALDHFERLARKYTHGKRRVSVFAQGSAPKQESEPLAAPSEKQNLIATLQCVGVSCLATDDGTVLTLPFDNTALRDTIWKTYLGSEEMEAKSRTVLIEYFSKKEPSLRYCEELPWHLKKCELWGDLKQVMIDLRVLDIMFHSSELKAELFNYLRLLSTCGKVKFDVVSELDRSMTRWVVRENPSSTIVSGLSHFLAEVMAWFSRGLADHTKSPPFMRESLDATVLDRLNIDVSSLRGDDPSALRRPHARGKLQPETLYFLNRWIWLQFPWLALKNAAACRDSGRQLTNGVGDRSSVADETAEPSAISVRDKAMLHARIGRPSTAVAKLDKLETTAEPKPKTASVIPFSSGTSWESRQDIDDGSNRGSVDDAAKQLRELKQLYDTIVAEADAKQKHLRELENASRIRSASEAKSQKSRATGAKVITELECRLEQLHSLCDTATNVDLVFQDILCSMHSSEPTGGHYIELEQQLVLSRQQIADLIESRSKKMSLEAKAVAEQRKRIQPLLQSLQKRVREEADALKVSRINSFNPEARRRMQLEGRVARRREAKARRMHRPIGTPNAAEDMGRAAKLHDMERLAQVTGTRDPASIVDMLKDDEADRLRLRQERGELQIKEQRATLESLLSQLGNLDLVCGAERSIATDEDISNAEAMLASRQSQLDSLSRNLLEVSLAIVNLHDLVQPAERNRRRSEFAQITAEAARPMTPNSCKLGQDRELNLLAQQVRLLHNEVPSELRSAAKQRTSQTEEQAEYQNLRVLNRVESETAYDSVTEQLHDLEDEGVGDSIPNTDEDVGKLASFVSHGIMTNQSQHEQRRANLLSRAKLADKGLVLESALQSASENTSP